MITRFNGHIVINTNYDYLYGNSGNAFMRMVFLQQLCIYDELPSYDVNHDPLGNFEFTLKPRTPKAMPFDLPDEILLQVPKIKKFYEKSLEEEKLADEKSLEEGKPLDKKKSLKEKLRTPEFIAEFKTPGESLTPEGSKAFVIVYNTKTKRTELRLGSKHYFATKHPAVFHNYLCEKFPVYKKFIEEQKKALRKPGQKDGELFPDTFVKLREEVLAKISDSDPDKKFVEDLLCEIPLLSGTLHFKNGKIIRIVPYSGTRHGHQTKDEFGNYTSVLFDDLPPKEQADVIKNDKELLMAHNLPPETYMTVSGHEKNPLPAAAAIPLSSSTPVPAPPVPSIVLPSSDTPAPSDEHPQAQKVDYPPGFKLSPRKSIDTNDIDPVALAQMQGTAGRMFEKEGHHPAQYADISSASSSPSELKKSPSDEESQKKIPTGDKKSVCPNPRAFFTKERLDKLERARQACPNPRAFFTKERLDKLERVRQACPNPLGFFTKERIVPIAGAGAAILVAAIVATVVL